MHPPATLSKIEKGLSSLAKMVAMLLERVEQLEYTAGYRRSPPGHGGDNHEGQESTSVRP